MSDMVFCRDSQTVYFATYYSNSRAVSVAHLSVLGPMDGPLPVDLIDLEGYYTKQGYVYRLDSEGNSMLLWSHRIGYAKPEYDPEYARYLELKAKYADVDTEKETV